VHTRSKNPGTGFHFQKIAYLKSETNVASMTGLSLCSSQV